MKRPNPIRELILYRFRMHYREPAGLFWGYGLPLLLAVCLGVAFRSKGPDTFVVDIEAGPFAAEVLDALEAAAPRDGDFAASIRPPQEAADRLRLGKTQVVVRAEDHDGALVYEYRFDPMRSDSTTARLYTDDALQRSADRTDPVATCDSHITEPGSRYIDFLIPGLLGMNIMGTGLWGVGFVLVELRVRKLLRRFAATPMRPSHFLLSLLWTPTLFALPELVVMIGTGVLLFDLPVRGSMLAMFVLVLCGAACFSGIGLLIASRAKKLETVMGLINVVQLPMWLLSGIFFSPDNFPDLLQPVVDALPLTHLNRALRNVLLDGASLPSQWPAILMLTVIGVICWALAIRRFRWN
jgi:ABC-type multidrug transport system permease subunit